jgi:hypothetical protein
LRVESYHVRYARSVGGRASPEASKCRRKAVDPEPIDIATACEHKTDATPTSRGAAEEADQLRSEERQLEAGGESTDGALPVRST